MSAILLMPRYVTIYGQEPPYWPPHWMSLLAMWWGVLDGGTPYITHYTLR